MMRANLHEIALAGPVAGWLRSLGCTVYAEVPFGLCSCAIIDLVGRRPDNSLIIVELKTALSRQVIRQAHLGGLYTDETYAAVPVRPKAASLAEAASAKIGVLRVIEGAVEVLLRPSGGAIVPEIVGKFHAGLDVMTPGDQAGMPTLAGEGPAQLLEPVIAQYRADHPGATWREIWAAVPNHYASPNGLRGGMAALVGRRLIRKCRLEVGT